MLSFQNLTLRIHTILQHMLSNPKPKNIMTHYFHSSMLKTIQFITTVYNYMISIFPISKYFLQNLWIIFTIYYMRRLSEDFQNLRRLTKSHKTLGGYNHKNEL